MASGPSKFDVWRTFQSEPGQCEMASRPSKFAFGVSFQSEPGQCDMASGPSNFDVWRTFQSEPGQCETASRPSKFDFWWGFRSEPEQRGMASRLANFNFWSEFRSGSWQRGIWFVVSKNVQLIVDSFHDLGSRPLPACGNEPGDCLTTKNLLARSRMRAEATKKILVPLPGLKFWFDSREVDFTCKSWSLAPQNRTFFPRSSKFDFGVSFESEPGQCDMASGPSKFDLWRTFQSEPGQCEMVSRPSKFDFWWGFQSEPEQRDVASRLANFNRWSEFRSESWQRGMASRLANFNFWSEFRSGSWQRGIWFVVSKNVQLIVDSFHDLDSLCPHAGMSQETVYSPGSLPHAGRGYQKPVPLPGLKFWFDSREVDFTCKSWSLAPQSRIFFPRPSKFDFWVFSCRKPESGMARRPSESVLPPHWVSGRGLRWQWRKCGLGSCAQGSVAQEGRVA